MWFCSNDQHGLVLSEICVEARREYRRILGNLILRALSPGFAFGRCRSGPATKA